MDISNMSTGELQLLQSLITKQLMKRKLCQMNIEDLIILLNDVKQKLVKEPPLKIEKITNSTFFIKGDDIRNHSEVVEREMKKYGDGGIDFYSDHEYDCFIFTFFNNKNSECCQENVDVLINRLTKKIY